MPRHRRHAGVEDERGDERIVEPGRRGVRVPEAHTATAPERPPIEPATIARELSTADAATRLRTLEALQHQYGNRYVQSVVQGLNGRAGTLEARTGAPVARRTVHLEIGRSTGTGTGTGTSTGTGAGGVGGLAIQREDPEPEGVGEPGAETLDAATAPPGATETIGPETMSTYTPSATTLAALATQLEARDEAGHVDWALSMTNAAPTGVITAVNITADITLEMPAWSPPATMLPKAKAEWSRAYAALLAHEQGHIKLVHDIFDGLAASLLGKTSRAGAAMFATAKASLAAASESYDRKTGHGQKTGTVIDVAIEQQEIDGAAKKKSADSAEKKEVPASPP